MPTTSAENVQSAKVLLYLDEEKMYSLYSQLFRGITDYWIRDVTEGAEETEKQKGPVGSGRELADAAVRATRTQEHRFVHDWAYSEFERRLDDIGAVRTVDETTLERPVMGFVRVSGPGSIRDMQAIIDFVKKYNDIGAAIYYVSHHEEIELARQARATTKDRNKRLAATQQAKSGIDIDKLARDSGLGFSRVFSDKLVVLMEQWFEGQFEAVIRPSSSVEYVAFLEPKFFREDKRLLSKKYGARVRLTLFGMVVQAADGSLQAQSDEEPSENSTVRDAMRRMIDVHIGIERQVGGLSDREIAIDPIAVYAEVPLVTATKIHE